MWSEVLTMANSVALNVTVPSLLSGIFIDTRRCNQSLHTVIFHFFTFYFHKFFAWCGKQKVTVCCH